MEPEFWHDRWQREMIGFHQSETNRYLKNYINRLALSPGDTVFVPLCGKSLDMWWLFEQGYKVIGVELSEIAAKQFFSEAGKQAIQITHTQFMSWKYEDIEIICGDFFDLNADKLGKVDAVFDRAALIALPLDMRMKYVKQLESLLLPATPGLLVTLEYPQGEMTGPPFSVSEEEVHKLYAARFNLELVEDHDALDENARFREQGLTSLHEKIYQYRKQ